MEFTQVIFNNSVPISHKTHCVSIAKTNQLKLFRETITAYAENNTRHTNYIVWAKCRGFKVTTCDAYSNHCALKG
jgi:hypothetical protein